MATSQVGTLMATSRASRMCFKTSSANRMSVGDSDIFRCRTLRKLSSVMALFANGCPFRITQTIRSGNNISDRIALE